MKLCAIGIPGLRIWQFTRMQKDDMIFVLSGSISLVNCQTQGLISMNKQDELAKCLNEVAASMERLSLMLETDDFMLNLYNKSVQTTGLEGIELNEFRNELHSVAHNIEYDSLALYECWLKSAKFFHSLTKEFLDKHSIEDMKPDDLVFENGSYITTGVAYNNGDYVARFYVEISRDCASFSDFNLAAKHLWDNHAKDSYGVE